MIVVGLAVAGLGVVFYFVPSARWLGRLPGDLRFGSGTTRVYLPIVTCLILSAVLTGVFWLVSRFR